MGIMAACFALTWMQSASAPIDVPRDHWAFPAVNELFQEGLLKGYPSGKLPPLKLDNSVKLDFVELERWARIWVKKKYFVIDSGCTPLGGRRSPSRYELAVVLHQVCFEVGRKLRQEKLTIEEQREILSDIPQLGQAISMLEHELTKLGGDVNNMFKQLNDLYYSPNRLFLGNNR